MRHHAFRQTEFGRQFLSNDRLSIAAKHDMSFVRGLAQPVQQPLGINHPAGSGYSLILTCTEKRLPSKRVKYAASNAGLSSQRRLRLTAGPMNDTKRRAEAQNTLITGGASFIGSHPS